MDIVERLERRMPATQDMDSTDMCDDMEDAIATITALRKRVAELEGAMTPSPETKYAYLGEFSFNFPAFDQYGNEVVYRPNVPWTTIKEIMAAISARAALRAKGGE